MTSAILLPTRIVVIYCPGWRENISAMRSNMRLCLRSISSFRRFLLVKAISMPEKNADNNSIKIISMTEVSIVLFI